MTVFAPEIFRAVMRDVPAVVVVVTARVDGVSRGMTASSFKSVSLDPPLVSVDVIQDSQMHEHLMQASSFTFNVLRVGQQGLADHFAQPDLLPTEQWQGVTLQQPLPGAIVLADALAWLHCVPHAQVEAGDHTIFIGRVEHNVLHPDGHPLLYFRRRYHRVGPALE